MSGAVQLGGGVQQAVERRGYDGLALRSQGDVRFLPANPGSEMPMSGQADSSAVLSPGDVVLAGQRIYPATGAKGLVAAGWQGVRVPYDANRVIRIEGVAGPQAGAAPLSVLGTLTLNALPTLNRAAMSMRRSAASSWASGSMTPAGGSDCCRAA